MNLLYIIGEYINWWCSPERLRRHSPYYCKRRALVLVHQPLWVAKWLMFSESQNSHWHPCTWAFLLIRIRKFLISEDQKVTLKHAMQGRNSYCKRQQRSSGSQNPHVYRDMWWWLTVFQGVKKLAGDMVIVWLLEQENKIKIGKQKAHVNCQN